MEIREFIATLEKSSFSLSVENGKLNLKGDRNKLTKAEIEAIKTNKEVIDYIKANKNELIEYVSVFSDATAVNKSKDVSSIYRLSGLQQGMLFHGLYNDETEAHKVQFICDLVGVNTELFSQSWSYLLKKHSVLRSGFYYDAFSVPVQCVYREAELPVALLDYRDLPEAEQAAALQNYEDADRIKGFDFKAAPLMRLALLQISGERYRMIWTLHHILFDGWSLSRLMEEFLNTYELLVAGKPVNQEEEDRYEDYIRYIERKDRSKEEAYWRNYLRNVQHSTLLPFIKTTTERNKGTGIYSTQHVELDAATTARIQQYAQRNRLTVNTMMQAAWAYLLHCYTGNDDVTYGVIVSGRPDDLPGVEQRVGMYINTLPLHTAINDEQKINEWLLQLQAEQVASRQYQYTSLSEVQQFTGVKGDLFDSILVFENYPISKVIGEKQWHLQVENVRMHDPANYPLAIVINSADRIYIDFHYNASLWEESYINAIPEHFKQILLQLINSTGKVQDISLLEPATAYQVHTVFHAKTSDYPNNKSIIDLFEEQVLKTPKEIAVVFEDQALTYEQLNERSNQLARFLRGKGVREEMLVPICIDRSLEMIVGILGILKTGGAYVPIDPAYPLERIRYILEDTDSKMLVSSSAQLKLKAGIPEEINVIELDYIWSEFNTEPASNLQIEILPDHLAYVIYTSGSTGRPKGVMIEHSAFININTFYHKILPGEQTILTCSYAFDVSVLEIFSSLLAGGCLNIPSYSVASDSFAFAKFLHEKKISTAYIHPMYLKEVSDVLDRYDECFLNKILIGVEPIRKEIVQWYLNRNIHVLNGYGPTEATICATFYHVQANPDSHIILPIGKPIENNRVLILNNNFKMTPAGVTGELFLGGNGLARGYLKRDELTAEKFIKDPFSKEPGARLYKTGDMGRWLPDGNIEYQGRKDNQVKLNGYRIEPGEIETLLQQHEQVRGAVVLAKADNTGNQRLIGYVVPKGAFDKEAITSYLKKVLPEYMVPALWVSLESFPVSPNGKIDRRALPDPDVSTVTRQAYVAPRNELEMELSLIFQELLGIDKVGVQDDFFELGGHSLLAMRAVSAIRRKVNKELAVKDLFEKPTIAALHHFIKSKSNGSIQPAIQAGPRPEHIPLSFSQERLWFIHLLEGSISYHLPTVLRLKGRLDTNALEHALQKVVNRHEVLRTVIREQEGQTYQYVLDKDGWRLSVEHGLTFENEPEQLQQRIKHLVMKPFDLSKDHMLRAHLLILNRHEQLLVLTMHHIASDGWSISILVKEVVEIYEAYVKNRPPQLADIQIQYIDYAIWQRNYLQGELLQEKLGYWKEKLADVAPHELPTDYARSAIQSTNSSVAAFHIDKGFTEQLQQLGNQHGATLFMTLLSVFKVLLYRYSGQEDICVGTPIANRTQYEIEGLIGFFINTLALRSKVNANSKFTELLEQVKATTLEAYKHQDVPFEKVVDAVVKHRDLSRSPLFQIMLVYQNTPEVPGVHLADVELSTEHFVNNTSKFDITFTVSETADGLRGFVYYRSGLYKATTIDRLLLHFKELLHAVVKTPTQKVGALPMLTKAEESKILFDFNDTQIDYPADETIITIFEKQVQCSSEAVALVFGKEQLTYRELNERCNQLACHLQSCGVKEEVLVPVCMEKSLEMMIAILGILKAGGAYVPVDPDYPLERIDFMLKDTQAGIVIAGEKQLDKLSVIFDREKIITPGLHRNTIASCPVTDVRTTIKGRQLAYVLYTSGSTGKPKGVQVQHDSFINHLQWFNDQYEISDKDSTLLLSSFSFDGCMTSMWPVLTRGGVLHLPENTLFDPGWLLNYVAQKSITYLKTLPGVFKAIIDDDAFANENIFASLRLIIVGGERVDANDFSDFLNRYPHVLFANHYGPTECTISSSFFLIDRTNVSELCNRQIVGKPVGNTRIYITGEGSFLNPVGVVGEICVGGIQVARGYLNLPELTAKKFITDPFTQTPGSRMYKTGDRGRWLLDGNIEYEGRIDEQVKIHGYRIELGEIESILQQSGLVQQSVVLAKENKEGTMQLVGYVVGTNFDREAILSLLRTKLPEYMVPALWLKLDSLPLTSNGKIDRKSLPDADAEALLTNQYVAPRNETEATLAQIWQELLHIEKVGIHDNFFELGGHSLLVMRLISSINREMKVELAVRDIFEFSTISALSKYVEVQISLLPRQKTSDEFDLLII